MGVVYSIIPEELLEADTNIEVTRRYRKLKTDEQRIVFTLNYMEEYDIEPSAITGLPKNAKESEKWRKQGNKVYVKGIHNNNICIEVLKLYTKSIAFAPYPSEQLALGYANRSAVLFQLNLYLECIQDIDRALALNYPDNLKAKLYLRKAECLMISENISARNMLKKAQHWLDKMPPNDTKREKLKAKHDVLRNKMVQMKLHKIDTKTKRVEPPVLPTFESYNNEVPCASNAVALKYNEQYGRHLVATRNIRPGEVIAVEKPYSLMLFKENIYTHCSNCLSVCCAPIPCNYCTYAMYCSEECRNIEWRKCHDIECAIFSALIECDIKNLDLFSIRLAILAVREAGGIKELRTMLKKVDERDDPRTKGFSRDGKLYSDRYIGVYSLVTNTEKRDVSDLFRLSLNTSFLLFFLATRTEMFGVKLAPDLTALADNNDVTFIGGLILKHQQIIPCNMLPFNEMRGLHCVNRGVAAVPFLSLINHSCDPNILRCSRPDHVVMHAMRPIRKGEQLLDCYIKHAMMPRAMRQEILRQDYYFNCDCVPCRKHWPLCREFESYHTLMKKPEDKAKIREVLRKYDVRLVDLLSMDNVLDIDRSIIIEDLLKVIQILYDCAPMPCEETFVCGLMLNLAYHLNGNVNVRFHKDESDTLYSQIRIIFSCFTRA